MSYILLVATLLLAACSTPLQPHAPLEATSNQPKESANTLDQRSETFLYLAAEDAINQGQYELATEFLKALLSKDPQADEPRLELVELLLGSQRAALAERYLQPLLDRHPLQKDIADRNLHIHVLHARVLAGEQQTDEALDLLTRILQLRPTLLSARLLQVNLYTGQQRFDMAEKSLEAGLAHRDSPELRRTQAEVYIRQQKFDAAEQALRAMHRLAPDDETPVLMLGNLALRRHDTTAAEKMLREFIAGHPQSYRSRNMLGRLMVQEGRTAEAIGIYHGLASDTGDKPEILSALGLLYFQNKQFEQAASQFRKILDSNPDGSARYYLGACLEAMEQTDKARQQYMQVAEDNPAWADAQLRIASIDFSSGEYTRVEKRARAVIKAQPKSPNAYLILSAACLAQEKYRTLLTATDPAMDLPRVPNRLLMNRAVAQEHFKQYKEVESTLKELLSQAPDDAEALNFLGYTYAEQGINLHEAEALIRRSLILKPDDGYYLDSLAWIFYKRGEYQKAADTQARAISGEPNDPVMHEHMGDIQWRLGQHDKARNFWKQAIELGHNDPAAMRRKINKGL